MEKLTSSPLLDFLGSLGRPPGPLLFLLLRPAAMEVFDDDSNKSSFRLVAAAAAASAGQPLRPWRQQQQQRRTTSDKTTAPTATTLGIVGTTESLFFCASACEADAGRVLVPNSGETALPVFALIVADLGKQNVGDREWMTCLQGRQGCGDVIGPGGVQCVHRGLGR